MIHLENDYSEGASLEIIKRLQDTNFNQHVGYGCDEICDSAKKRIQAFLENDKCDIHFLVGGTQCNATIIDHILKPYEAVIACDSGHINVHETGAIEASGHKVLTAPNENGLLSVEAIEMIYQKHSDEHMVKPRLVYISNATEYGTIYSYERLKAIRECCDRLGLLLFMDGARLGVALTGENNDLKANQLCDLCDVFYLGGTKNGALFGEAVVIVNESIKQDFRYMIKAHGGMLAKGWLLGIQFDELFQNDLYLSNARHANELAMRLKEGMLELGIKLYMDSTTNQQFPILSLEQIEKLKMKYIFQFWESVDDDHHAIRFVTSWASKQEDVDNLLNDLENLR